MPFKIRTKLLIAFLAIIFPFTIIAGILVFYNASAFRKAAHKVETVSEERAAITNIILALERSLMPGNDYLITADRKYIDDFYKASQEVEKRMKEAEGVVLSGTEDMNMLGDTEVAWRNIKDISQKIFVLHDPTGRDAPAGRLYMKEMDYRWAYPAIERLKKWRGMHLEEYKKAVNISHKVWVRSWIIMGIVVLVLIISGVSFAFFYSNLFVKPIKAIHESADSIARGEFKTRLDIKTGDELEQLSGAMNEMAEKLDSFYGTLEKQIEERTTELRYERDKLKSVFEAMEDGVYLVDHDYNIQYLNPVLLKGFGPIEGKKCYAYFHDRTEVCPWCPNQRVFAGETVRWEWTSLKNGKTYDLLDTPLRQPDGSIWKLEIFRDITDRKKAEEALYKSEELLKLQINRMPVGYIVWDTSFRVMSWNPAAERIFGFTSEEAKGKHPYDLIVPKEAQPHVDKIWQRLLEGDATAHSVNENLTKDGRTIICEWTNTPLRYHNGDTIGALSMVQDITERKKADEALKESETRYKGLIESVTDYIFTVQIENGRPVKTTHGQGCVAITGYASKEYETNPNLWLEMVHEGDRDAVVRQGEAVLSGKAEPLEHRIVAKGGRIKWVRNVSVPHYDERGRLVSYDGLISDITERKKAEEALKQRLGELMRFEKATIQREFRIKDLKDENKRLKEKIEEMEKKV